MRDAGASFDDTSAKKLSELQKLLGKASQKPSPTSSVDRKIEALRLQYAALQEVADRFKEPRHS